MARTRSKLISKIGDSDNLDFVKWNSEKKIVGEGHNKMRKKYTEMKDKQKKKKKERKKRKKKRKKERKKKRNKLKNKKVKKLKTQKQKKKTKN